jgi:tRNA pseudouridine13 synthase
VKLKCRPEDFRVEEQVELSPGRRGGYGLYLLEKRNLTTFEAIGMLARHLGRPARSISAGGLKDKYALTRQHITVAGKPVGAVRLKGLSITPLGRLESPMRAQALRGNRFRVVLRDIPGDALELLRERAGLAARQGLPNYFDEQRFGSLRAGGEFLARRLLDGNVEGALRMHLAAPSRRDSSRDRARRRRLDELWGDWARAFEVLPRGNDRSVVAFLRDHPTAFSRAFELIERRLAQLYLFAYQSYIWNQTLAGLLGRTFPPEALFAVRYAAGRLTFFDAADGARLRELAGLEIALPSRKADYGRGPLAEAAAEALGAEGISTADFRLRGFRKLHFRAGRRRALVRPEALRLGRAEADELHPGRQRLRLEFALPPGSYATLLVKFIGRDLLPGSRAARRKRR